MSIVIELPARAESRLLSRAESSGQSAEAIAARILEDALDADEWDDWEDIDFLRKSIADCEEGRVKSAEEVLARLSRTLAGGAK